MTDEELQNKLRFYQNLADKCEADGDLLGAARARHEAQIYAGFADILADAKELHRIADILGIKLEP